MASLSVSEIETHRSESAAQTRAAPLLPGVAFLMLVDLQEVDVFLEVVSSSQSGPDLALVRSEAQEVISRCILRKLEPAQLCVNESAEKDLTWAVLQGRCGLAIAVLHKRLEKGRTHFNFLSKLFEDIEAKQRDLSLSPKQMKSSASLILLRSLAALDSASKKIRPKKNLNVSVSTQPSFAARPVEKPAGGNRILLLVLFLCGLFIGGLLVVNHFSKNEIASRPRLITSFARPPAPKPNKFLSTPLIVSTLKPAQATPNVPEKTTPAQTQTVSQPPAKQASIAQPSPTPNRRGSISLQQQKSSNHFRPVLRPNKPWSMRNHSNISARPVSPLSKLQTRPKGFVLPTPKLNPRTKNLLRSTSAKPLLSRTQTPTQPLMRSQVRPSPIRAQKSPQIRPSSPGPLRQTRVPASNFGPHLTI